MINIGFILMIAGIIEVITLFGRFIFKISSKDICIRLMKKWKMKKFYHFHHLFFGLLVALVFYFYSNQFLFNAGLAIMLSDIIHHFIMLQMILGHPEFHIVYKNMKRYKKEEKFEDKKIKGFFKHLIHKVR
jgi:hypothetical protein